MQRLKILLTIAIILSFSLSFLSFTTNPSTLLKHQPFLTTTNLKMSVDVDPPTTTISYTPTFEQNGYMMLDFEDQSLHDQLNNLNHFIYHSAPPYQPIITDKIPAHSGTYSMKLESNGGGNIAWLWNAYTRWTVYQFSAWIYINSSNFISGYINLIKDDYPAGPVNNHMAMSYLQFHGDTGHAYAENFLTFNLIDLGVYPIDTWFNATIKDNKDSDSTGFGCDTYTCYINSVAKGTTYSGGDKNAVNSFSVESTNGEMYCDDFQMNWPAAPQSKPFFVSGSTDFTLSTNDNDSDAFSYFQIWDNTTSTMLLDWTVYSSAFQLGSSGDGIYTIIYRSIDDCGIEAQKYETVTIDAIPPITTLHFTPAYSTDFVNASTFFTIEATDGNGSEIAPTYPYYAWQANGGAVHGPMPYTGPFQLVGAVNGTAMILYFSADNVGNTETFNLANLRIDTIPPTSAISYTPVATIGSRNYVTSSTLFSLSATDVNGSGVAAKYYNWTQASTNHATTHYMIPFMLSSAVNGSCNINYWAQDNVGNNATANTTIVFIDTIAPVTVIHYTPAFAPNYVNSSTQFTLTASDNPGGSGIFLTLYRLNKAPWTLYTGAFNLTGEGNNTVVIDFFSIDIAGNAEYVNSITVENSQHHVDVTIRYASSIDGWGIDYLEVFTFINGTESDVNTVRFYGAMIFNLTVENVFNVAIYSHIYDASTTGPSLRITLPMTTLKVKNNFLYPVVFHLSMHGKELTFSLNPNDELQPRVALGTYIWWITNSSDGAIIPAFKNNATTYFIEKITGSSPSINFGWVNASTGPVDIWSIMAGYIVFFAVIIAVFAVVLGLMTRSNAVKKAKASSEGNPKERVTRGRY